MPGVLINAVLIVAGGLLGLVLGSRVSEKIQKTVTQGLALCVLIIGLSGALGGSDTIGMIVCIVLGAIIGEALDIEKALEKLGDRAQKLIGGKGGKSSNISEGFVTASLLFCVGAMAVVGSLDAGILGKYDTLIAKGLLDAVSALFFASSLGVGVLLSAVSVFVYQGAIALLAGVLQPLLSEEVISLMSCTGGLLIAGIGINMMGLTKIKVGNMLPAVFLPLAYVPLYQLVSGLFA